MSYNQTMPWALAYTSELEKLKHKNGRDVEFFVEFLEMGRLQRYYESEDYLRYLKSKYAKVRLDAVILESAGAAEFAAAHGEAVFGDVPYVIVFSNDRIDINLKRYHQLNNNIWIEKTLDFALAQKPDARKAVVIGNGSPDIDLFVDSVTHVLKERKASLDINVESSFTLEEIEKKLSQLGDDTFVVYTLAVADRTGKYLEPKEVLARLCKASRVPVYAFSSAFLEDGIVGGYLRGGAYDAEASVDAAMRMAKGQPVQVASHYVHSPLFNYEALKKWGIRTSSLPADAKVLFEEETIFSKYLYQILFIAVFIVAETILLVVLYRFYAEKKFLSESLLQLNDELERRVHERTSELQCIAVRDGLTGLYNKEEFIRLAGLELERVARNGGNFSVVMIDLDHFKRVNDQFGHLIGDQALKHFALLLLNNTRKTDVLARFGGEEFIALLPDTDPDHAFCAMDKLRDLTATSRLAMARGVMLSMTASFGISCAREGNGDLTEILKAADRRLYAAKKRGRNRVCSQDDERAAEPMEACRV